MCQKIFTILLNKILPHAVCERYMLMLLLPDAFRGLGAGRKTMLPQKPSKALIRNRREKESPKSKRHNDSIAGVQNEMRGT